MILLKIVIVILLVMLNGFFVAAEFALVKIRDTQLDPLIQKGHRRARAARHIIGNLDRYLSAAQMGITLASLALGWVGEPIFSAVLEPVLLWMQIQSEEVRHTIAVVVGFTAITFLHITAGEQAPKWFAIQKPLVTALWVAQPLAWFCAVTFPFIWILNQSSLWMLRQFGIEPANEADAVHSEEELRLVVSTNQRAYGTTALGRDIVLNALDLRRRIARDVMRPRAEISVLDTQASMTECLDLAEKTRYSRFPLCEEGDPDRTLGVVHLKDLFASRLKARKGADLASAARKLIYIPETCRLEKLLQLFLERRLHMGIVVDEYGGTVGLVTLENILEALVGQIQDEFDQEKPMLVQRNATAWEILGTLPIHQLSELTGEPLGEAGVTTTSGFVTQRLGGFPKSGDVISLGSWELRVEELDGPIVARLSLRRTTPDQENEPSA